ncbi:hypothetical protein Ancab_018217 [Ancistrocladus abbreviatus]
MDGVKAKRKKSLIVKTWERCRSFGHGSNSKSTPSLSSISFRNLLLKSKSWSAATSSNGQDDCRRINPKKRRITPSGCFSVYVGPERQRFVIKAKSANHPLFKTLLDEAELEYGFSTQGPIILPCNVEVFVKVLFEMDSDDHTNEAGHRNQWCSSCPRRPNSNNLFSSDRFKSLAAMNQLLCVSKPFQKPKFKGIAIRWHYQIFRCVCQAGNLA